MKKLLLPALFIFIVLFALSTATTIATERPPIDFLGTPLKLWVPYDPKKPGDIYALKQDYVFIQAKDLKEIEDAKNPTKTKSDEPPVNYQLASATYYANVKGDYINVTGVYNIDKLDNEWTLIPIISDQVGLSSSTIGGKPAFMTTFKGGQDLSKFKNANSVSSGNYFLALKDKGIHQLKINFSLKIDKDPSVNTQSFAFDLPDIPIVSLHCVVNQKNLEYHVPQAISISSKDDKEGTKLFASFPPVRNIQVKWNPKSTFTAKETSEANLPPSITAVSYSRIEVGRKTLKGTNTFDIDIRHAALDHFDFYVPEDVEIDSVTSTGNVELVNPSPQPNKGILSVDLTSAVEGKLMLNINFRKTFDTPSFQTQLPAITLADNMKIDREVGYVGVVETTNIESTVVNADAKKNYQQIDSTEFEGPLTGIKASIAFKYQKNKESAKDYPYDITIKVVRHEGVKVFEATIKSTDITSVLNEDGQIFSKATFQVTNTKKQFLEVTLPKNSEIWSVFVDGRSVKPAVTDEKLNKYSIPLSKSTASETGGKTFPLEIVYFTNSKFVIPTWALGMVDIKAISPELDTNSIRWTLYYPQKTSFWPISLFSNLEEDKSSQVRKRNLLDHVQAFDQSIMQTNKMVEGQAMPQEQLQSAGDTRVDEVAEAEPELNEPCVGLEKSDSESYRQKEESKKLSYDAMQSDIKDKGGAYGGKAQMRQQAFGFMNRKVGKLPVYVNLPQVGESYHLYQNSFQANKEPHIVTFYSHKKLFDYIILALVVIIGMYLVAPIKQKQFKSIKFIVLAVVFTVLLFTLIGFNKIPLLILLLVIYGFYKLLRWILTFNKPLRNKVMFILGGLLILVALLLISMLIDSVLCFGVLIVLIALAIGVTIIVWIVKSGYWPFKKKVKEAKAKNGEPQESISDSKEEGQDNE